MNPKQLAKKLFRKTGFDIVRVNKPPLAPSTQDLANSDESLTGDEAIIRAVRPFTLTGVERIQSVIDSIRYICKANINGSFVECGVWRGGSSMAAALTFMQENDMSRDLYLFDTYEGMTPPSDFDIALDGISAEQHLALDTEKQSVWCIADIEDVTTNMRSTGYPEDCIHYVKGPVEKTVTKLNPPGQIALLRLDTDWYESTKHELIHLFPRLATGGILIVDDYGHWKGSKKAVDEYLDTINHKLFMHRIDYTGRLIVKTF